MIDNSKPIDYSKVPVDAVTGLYVSPDEARQRAIDRGLLSTATAEEKPYQPSFVRKES